MSERRYCGGKACVLTLLALIKTLVLLDWDHILGGVHDELFNFQTDKLFLMNLQDVFHWAAGTKGSLIH